MDRNKKTHGISHLSNEEGKPRAHYCIIGKAAIRPKLTEGQMAPEKPTPPTTGQLGIEYRITDTTNNIGPLKGHVKVILNNI